MTKGSVTLKDIYEVVQRVEDKMDVRIKEVEKRVDILEDLGSKALGILGVVSFIGTALFSWFWNKITRS